MPTRGRLAVLGWGLVGVMEHQIVAFGREGGNRVKSGLRKCDSRIRGSAWARLIFASRCSSRAAMFIGVLVSHNGEPSPLFFVSVASKEFNNTVSLLFATHAGRSISVAGKELKGMVAIDGRIAGGSRKTNGPRILVREDK